MQFAARAARAGVTHHPEIVLLVAVDDVHGGIQPGGGEDGRPAVVRLLVEFARVALARLVDGGEEPFLREPPDAGEQLPGPLDRLLFEVVAERPVAEHLEEGVMVGVHPDVLEVVMLAAGADALLRVGGASGSVRAGQLAEEDRHELVHAGVGKQQVGRVRHEAGRRHDGVLFVLKKIEEGLSDLRAGLHRPAAKKRRQEEKPSRRPTARQRTADLNGTAVNAVSCPHRPAVGRMHFRVAESRRRG